jgi:hypothetical protein
MVRFASDILGAWFLYLFSVVLQKYRTPKDAVVEIKEDLFYTVLRERVTAVLLENGVDPHSDRAATPLRMSYYAFLLVSVLVTGYYHIKVRFRIRIFGRLPYQIQSYLTPIFVAFVIFHYRHTIGRLLRHREVLRDPFGLPFLGGFWGP